jgi:tetratricopeptide (TPR) repeat protein
MKFGIVSITFVFSLIALLGQSNERSASVHGTVRDAQGHAAAAVTVQLKTEDLILSVTTDSDGSYRFSAIPAGSYNLKAKIQGKGQAAFGPFEIAPNEAKRVDLTLAAADAPAFFDEPTFIVAGVTASSNSGGHGSDTVLRSAEALSKATTALSQPGNASTQSIASLREAIAREPATAEPHHALADAEERAGNSLEAVHEYERAAELDASERNLFDWGAELLLHRASEPATEVFLRGNRLFPRSVRVLLGLAASYYARGMYDQATARFFEATDLNPDDSSPYLFLSKVQSRSITEIDGFVERLARFAKLHPEVAWADYAYAASLWKRGNGTLDASGVAEVRSLLEKAIRLDPNLAAAHLELGIVLAAEKKLPEAIAAYQQAIRIDPTLEEAHYRLAQAYERIGNAPKAREEIEIHARLAKESQEKFDRERREIQEFVIELRGRPPKPQ